MKKVIDTLFFVGDAVVIVYLLAKIFLGLGDVEDYGYLLFAVLYGVIVILRHFVYKNKQ